MPFSFEAEPGPALSYALAFLPNALRLQLLQVVLFIVPHCGWWQHSCLQMFLMNYTKRFK